MRIYEILKKTSPEDVISKIKLHYGDKYIDRYKNLFYDLLNMNPTCNGQKLCILYNVPLVKTQMKKIIVTAKTLYSHPKNVSKIYAALHTDLAW